MDNTDNYYVEKKEDINMKLKDIFPHLNKTLNNGLIIENGVCTDLVDINNHIQYLGISDSISSDEDISFYFPKEVTEIDEDFNIFNCPGQEYDSLVFTTNLKGSFPLCACRGFRHVYIVDPETEDVLFHSEKFYCDEYDFLSNDDLWIGFWEDYNDDPFSTMKTPCYFDPDVDLEW